MDQIVCWLLGAVVTDTWCVCHNEPNRRCAMNPPQTQPALPASTGSMRLVSVLCAGCRSVYRGIPGVDVYDAARDARTFVGGTPVVCHPPCRSWSAYCAHQAKPLPGERDLGPWCVEQLRRCGGVLEHPAYSRLWSACGLPLPGQMTRGDLWSAEVLQAWWGDTRTKTTWLLFCGLSPNSVQFPIRLHDPRGDRRRWQVMSHTQRSATVPAMAQWLVDAARRSMTSNTPAQPRQDGGVL